jgi:uncharacterized membrane protein
MYCIIQYYRSDLTTYDSIITTNNKIGNIDAHTWLIVDGFWIIFCVLLTFYMTYRQYTDPALWCISVIGLFVWSIIGCVLTHSVNSVSGCKAGSKELRVEIHPNSLGKIMIARSFIGMPVSFASFALACATLME